MPDISFAAPRRTRNRQFRRAPGPLTAGTIVLTLDGALPVEYLAAGDRIVTRAGARVLRDIRSDEAPDLPAFTLGFDAPEVIYADGQEIAVAPLV